VQAFPLFSGVNFFEFDKYLEGMAGLMMDFACYFLLLFSTASEEK